MSSPTAHDRKRARRQRRVLPIARAASTIQEFCDDHRISRGHYYQLRNRGLGPDETDLFGKIVITHESAARWRKQRTAASKRSGTALKGAALPNPAA